MSWIAAISPASSVADLPCAYMTLTFGWAFCHAFAPPTSVK